MPDRKIIECIAKDLQGRATPEEAETLKRWLEADMANGALYERLRQKRGLLEGTVVHRRALGRRKQVRKRVLEAVSRDLAGETRVIRMRWWWAAASAILLLTGGTWWWMSQRAATPAVSPVAVRVGLEPGRNKATLILADKKEVVLDAVDKGAIARQGEAKVTKTDSGEIAYNIETHNQPPDGKPDLEFNTILTPRGGQYRLRLADGTIVFLNAQSSLRFPVTFGGKDRKVYLQGEGYFEVAPDRERPFKVDLESGREIKVLGTRFDVRNYTEDGEGVATLLEGKIRVENEGKLAVLTPDERAAWGQAGVLQVGRDDMADASIAWTKGLFRFRNTSLGEAMREIARWYDVSVEFEGGAPDLHVTASINRNTSAWAVLDALKEIAGLKCKVEGRKIIVLR